MNAETRPTTSRLVPNPPPDLFASYVVPSPTKDSPSKEVPWDFAEDNSDTTDVDTDVDSGIAPVGLARFILFAAISQF